MNGWTQTKILRCGSATIIIHSAVLTETETAKQSKDERAS